MNVEGCEGARSRGGGCGNVETPATFHMSSSFPFFLLLPFLLCSHMFMPPNTSTMHRTD